MRRRFLQRFKQRVERVPGQHVHLVDQVHLEATARGRVLRVLDHLAHVVHTGIAGGVDLQQIDKAALVHRRAHRARAARVGRLPALAIQRLGEDACDGGLADATGAGKQVGVMHAPTVERVGERAHHVLLPDQFGELARSPLACEYLIRHSVPPWGECRLCQVEAGFGRRGVSRQRPAGNRSRSRSTEKAAAPPATLRHPNHSLPLLPSGPGGVCELSSRRDRRGHHRRGLLSPGTDGPGPFQQLAERAGFEPAIRLTVYTLSRRAPSTTRTPLRLQQHRINNTSDQHERDGSAHPEPPRRRGATCSCPDRRPTHQPKTRYV